jgi:Transposase DDE domain/Domain of unknown function (DUF4372)
MHRQPTVFAQLLKVLPFDHFEHLVDKYQANRYSKTLPAWAHLVCMVYAQLTRREGLRDLVACLNSRASQLYHLGIRHRLSRSTLADAAQRRDCQLFEALGQRLITTALALHQDDAIPLGLKEPLYAMDSTTISLCLNLFTWAYFRSTKAAVKAHTVLDLRGTIPVFIAITTGDIPDNKLLGAIALPANATVVLDRGYVDFTRLYALAKNKLHFVVRAKDNLHYRRVHSRRVDEATGLRADDTIWLVNKKSRRAYPRRLRRIEFYDGVNHVTLVLLTNRFDLPALTIAQIYKERWKIELFFKWLKQNLTVKHFFGNSENAVRSQIWIAICVYLMVLIAHKQLKLDISLQLLLHLIEVNIFERISLQDLVALAQSLESEWPENQQMSLL